MNEKSLIRCRIRLMDSLFDAQNELTHLGWLIQDGKATREDALKICRKLSEASSDNSAEKLDAMEDAESTCLN